MAVRDEHDMDFAQFCIMFRSIFLEGLARPLAGMRLILKNLVRRFGPGGRAAAAGRGQPAGDSKPERCARCSWTTARSWPRTTSSRRPAGWKPCGCATDAAASEPRPAGQLSFLETRVGPECPAAATGLQADDRVFQRQRQVPLAEARRAGRRPQRRDLFAEQFPLRRAARTRG